MIAIGSATETRFGAMEHPEDVMLRPVPAIVDPSSSTQGARGAIGRIFRWLIGGYQRVNATDLASAVAFQALVAILPMFLLLVSIGGLFLQDASVLRQATLTIAWVLPASGDAFRAALDARSNSGLFGALSLLGFAWVGTGFVSAMARSMNRIYGVPNAGYIKEKQRGFIVILLFALFFMIASSASIVTTFFVGNQDRLPPFIRGWVLTSGQAQFIAYAIAFIAAFCLFITIYRLVPNAGQRIADVWLGALVSSLLFLVVTQVFPLYLRYMGGSNRYGVALALVSLMVAAFYAIAHVILFGCFINASWQQLRRERGRRRRERDRDDGRGAGGGDGRTPTDPQSLRAGMMDPTLR